MVAAATVTLGYRALFGGGTRLLSNDGGSPALRAITAIYGLILAFMLAASLQSYGAAQTQVTAEADSVVAMGNLSLILPAPVSTKLHNDLACYARVVVNREFPAMTAHNYQPLDDDRPILAMYGTLSAAQRAGQVTSADLSATVQQLSTLTSQRDARIRSAHNALPWVVWTVLIAGGVIVMLAVGAVTLIDRPWPQFFILWAVGTIIATALTLVSALSSPYSTAGLSITSEPMKATIRTLGVPTAPCSYAGLPLDDTRSR